MPLMAADGLFVREERKLQQWGKADDRSIAIEKRHGGEHHHEIASSEQPNHCSLRSRVLLSMSLRVEDQEQSKNAFRVQGS